MMQKKHDIDTILFSDIIPLESEIQVEYNISATTQVSTEVKEIETETKKEIYINKEAYKEKTETEAEAKNEAQLKEAFIAKKDEQNQLGSTNIFNSNIDFQSADTQNDYEEELFFLEAWLATPCLDKVCIEATKKHVEDILDDENINEIFRYWSHEEMKLYYGLMLQQINDEKRTAQDNMWQQYTYKWFIEEVQDMLGQLGRMEDLHQQRKKLKFEGYNKEKKLKQFRGYSIWKKRRRKVNVVEVNFLNLSLVTEHVS